MSPHGIELSEDLKQIIVALHKDGVGYKKIAAARWPRPYSGLKGQVPLRTGLAMVDQRSWVHLLSVISRGCVWKIDVWVLPALLQRLKGRGGRPVSAKTIRRTLHQIGLHGCRPRRKHLLKMMHKKARKQFAEDKQTKDMNYWNHVLWSDETKINWFSFWFRIRWSQACVVETRWGVKRQVCLAYSQA